MPTSRLRILIVHNSYQQRGGEDAVVENESALLREAGHTVEVWTVSNNIVRGLFTQVGTALKLVRNPRYEKELLTIIERFNPDVAHFHNTFPLLTPSIYGVCHRAGVGVVKTLHNYRLICAGALLARDGEVCEKCVGASPYWGAVHACYKDSHLGSWAVAHMNAVHQRRGTWNSDIDRIIVLTQFARSRMIHGGLEPARLVVKPNFLPQAMVSRLDAYRNTSESQNNPPYALFVGRLSQEKGVTTLLDAAAQTDASIRIVGDGPLMAEVQRRQLPNVKALGWLSHDDVLAQLAGARCLLLPSLWYEGFPMTVVEGFACGVPVICSKLGSLEEIVTDGETGLHFPPGDSAALATCITRAMDDTAWSEQSGKNARQQFERCYTPQASLEALESLYASL